MPNAAITIIDNSTGQSRAAVTTDDGTYAFTDVPAGSYTLTVTAKGFRVSRTTNVQVAINAVSRNDVRLQVGELAETVNVEASAADPANGHRRSPRLSRLEADHRTAASRIPQLPDAHQPGARAPLRPITRTP